MHFLNIMFYSLINLMINKYSSYSAGTLRSASILLKGKMVLIAKGLKTTGLETNTEKNTCKVRFVSLELMAGQNDNINVAKKSIEISIILV